jgi:hypothetical protein
MSAGARLIVMRLLNGHVRPLFRTAERTRSFDSCTAVSGSPTTVVVGFCARAMSTSTSTSTPSRPITAQLSTFASTAGLWVPLIRESTRAHPRNTASPTSATIWPLAISAPTAIGRSYAGPL